jgi:Cupin-like domain
MKAMSTTVMQHSATNLLDFDDAKFRDNFPHRGFLIQHHLRSHPALELPNLVQLAQRLPESSVEYYSGKVSLSQDARNYPKNGLSIAETVRRIEECGSWMVLKNVQHDTEFGPILRTALDEVYARFPCASQPAWAKEIHRENAFIFISSPNSVTPFHVDDEHNFLLQIRGSKKVAHWAVDDRTVISEEQIESLLEFWHDEQYQRYTPYEEASEKRATIFDLQAGHGLHFPFGAPHWVENGSEVSVSFSITWRSLMSEQQAIVYYLNRRLRRLGLRPTPPNQSAFRDSLKLKAFFAARRARRALKGSWSIQDKWS